MNSELCAFYLLCIIRINCVVLRLVMMSYKAQEPLGGNIAYGSVGCAAWELLEEHSWSTADVTFSERCTVIHTVRSICVLGLSLLYSFNFRLALLR